MLSAHLSWDMTIKHYMLSVCLWNSQGALFSFRRRPCACRGIDVVRNKIKMFAQTKVTLPPGRHKMVILDEADRYGHGLL